MISCWKFCSYEDLSKQELHQMMVLRQEVFVVEQDCPYQDADHKDVDSFHLLGFDGDELRAYLRLVKPDISYPEMSFGRIVTASKSRGKGMGKLLIQEGLKCAYEQYGQKPIRISAQTYLTPFYSSFGFVSVGEEYLEDDIPHIEMLKP